MTNTPTLDEIVAAARQLSLEERRALVRLIEPPKPLEQIAAEQGIKPFDFKAAQIEAEGLWPEDETADDFNAAVRQWRNEGTALRDFD